MACALRIASLGHGGSGLPGLSSPAVATAAKTRTRSLYPGARTAGLSV